jgi:NADH:ubiquinone oxidoreductase subunit
MRIGTYIYTKLFGELVGKDQFGNSYFQSRKFLRDFGRYNRWVCYIGDVEPSKVPSQWFSWLHYQTDDVPANNNKKYSWERDFIPNLTGTNSAYYPSGHVLGKGKRSKATGDYQPWRPNNKKASEQ